jgi:hypothetical protein
MKVVSISGISAEENFSAQIAEQIFAQEMLSSITTSKNINMLAMILYSWQPMYSAR